MITIKCDRCGEVQEGPHFFQLSVTPAFMNHKRFRVLSDQPYIKDLCQKCVAWIQEGFKEFRKPSEVGIYVNGEPISTEEYESLICEHEVNADE